MNEDPSIQSAEDRDLLRRFAEGASVAAFEELVRRHLNPVFSAALRRVNGDHALANDVTQTVFIDFARKASGIKPDMPPGGWLHRHTGFVASKMIDKERRRRAREQEAATMNTNPIYSADDPDWASTAPLLDAAMDTLPVSDRDAIVLRFFEQKDLRSVGAALGMSDDSAQKKVSRAIDKLRGALGRRGVASTGGALAALLVANSVKAAPPMLVGQIAAQSLAGAATATSGNLLDALSSLSTAARVQAAAAAVALAAVAGLAGTQLSKPAAPPAAEPLAARETPRSEVAPVTAIKPAPAPEASADPMSIDALVAAAAAEWRGGQESVAASAKALGFLSQITPEQMRQALEAATSHGDVPARALLTRHLLSHWAESEPAQAMEWAQSGAAHLHQADMIEGVLNAWAARDPEAVMGWKAKAPAIAAPRLSESVIGTVFRTIAKKDPERALARLAKLTSPNDRGQALRGILDTVQTDSARAELATVVAKIPEDDIRIQARRAVIEQWARRDAAAAAAFVEQAEPDWERTRLMDTLGFTWLQTDPAPAAEWWVAQAPGPDTLVKIINVWAQQDPNAAGAWLDKQPPGPASDTARMTFARQVADLDPENSLRWAETVSDTAMAEGTIDHIFANWRLRDTAEANAFLKGSGWPAERVARLLKSPNKNPKSL